MDAWLPSSFRLGLEDRPRLGLVKGSGRGGSSRSRPDGDEEDDDPEDDDEEDDDPEDDDEEDDELADKTDDELRDMLRDAQDRLKRSGSSNAGKSKRIRALKRELAEKRKAPARKAAPAGRSKNKDDDEDDREAALEQARQEAREEARSEGNKRIVRAEARGMLRDAGVESKSLKRAVGLLELDDIDVDDDGDVDPDEVASAIDKLRDELPALFGDDKPTRRSRTRVAGRGDSDGKARPGAETKRKPTPTELQVAAATGKKVQDIMRSRPKPAKK